MDYYAIQKLVEGTWVDLRRFQIQSVITFQLVESTYKDLRNASPDTEYRLLEVKHQIWRQGKGPAYDLGM